MFRFVNKRGFAQNYRTHPEFKRYVRSPPSLSFLSVDQVFDAFTELERNAPAEMMRIFDYFQKFKQSLVLLITIIFSTYIQRIQNAEVVDPEFPLESWNMHENIVTDAGRTNNAMEAWHRAFRCRFNNAHSAFLK